MSQQEEAIEEKCRCVCAATRGAHESRLHPCAKPQDYRRLYIRIYSGIGREPTPLRSYYLKGEADDADDDSRVFFYASVSFVLLLDRDAPYLRGVDLGGACK